MNLIRENVWRVLPAFALVFTTAAPANAQVILGPVNIT